MKKIFDPEMDKDYKAYVSAYMRYSSANQDEESIKYQRAAILTYAHHKGYFVSCEYIDEARSGTTDRRNGFQQMIADAKSNPTWSKILVYDLSRFARNNTDASKYTAELEDLGIELISVTQEFDNSNEGYLLRGIVNLLNEYYSRNLAKHTHAGLKLKAKDGKHCGGTPPLGYDIVNENLVINEYEAEIVGLIFEMYENGYSYRKMAQELNAIGYTNKQGRPFTVNSFFSILHQEKYIGTYIWNKVAKKNSKGKRNNHKHKPEAEQVIIKDAVPVIISKEQFERVQKLFADRKNGTATSKSRHFYLLSGNDYLKCAYCGCNMIGSISSSHGKDYKYYYCPNHKEKKGEDKCPNKGIRADLLEPFVIRSVVSDIFKRDDMVEIYNNIDEKSKIKELTYKLNGLKKSTTAIFKTIKDTYDTPAYADARAELKEIAQNKANIKQELEKLKALNKEIDDEDRKKVCLNLIKFLENNDSLEAKKYLKSAISDIIVSNEDVELTLNIA